MNPEDQLRRFNDRSEWAVRLNPKADAFPARKRMSPWMVSLATVAAIDVVVAVIFASFGLSVQSLRHQPAQPALPSETSTPIVTPTASPTSTATETPTHAPTVTGYEGTANCTNILNPSTIDNLKSKGYVEVSKTYSAKYSDGSDPEGDFAKVLEYGGVVCAWARPVEGADVVFAYSYGLIGASQANAIRTEIKRASTPYTHTAAGSIDRYIYKGTMGGAPSDVGGGYLFGDGFWAISLDNGAGVNALSEIVENADKVGALPTGSPTPTMVKPPYLTTAGYGDIRLGRPVPKTSGVTWIPKMMPGCVPDSSWYIKAGGYIYTEDPSRKNHMLKDGAVTEIDIFVPEIQTKSGAHVGMTVTDLRKVLPAAKYNAASGVWVVSDSLGQVAFYPESTDADSPIKTIRILPVGVQPTDYVPAQSCD